MRYAMLDAFTLFQRLLQSVCAQTYQLLASVGPVSEDDIVRSALQQFSGGDSRHHGLELEATKPVKKVSGARAGGCCKNEAVKDNCFNFCITVCASRTYVHKCAE